MTKITDRYEESADAPLFICDFSPPRGAGPELLEPAGSIDADWISVAYNPGRSTRVSPPIAAHWIKEHTGRDVVFTLATRDMNKIAMQSLLLGAQLMGLENVVVVQGDRLTERDLSRVRDASDYRPTELLGAIREMNQGIDFKGLRLRSPTDFCVGTRPARSRSSSSRGIETQKRSSLRCARWRRAPSSSSRSRLSTRLRPDARALELLDRYAEEQRREAVGAGVLRSPGHDHRQSCIRRCAGVGDGWARQGSLRCGHSPGGARPVHSGRVPVVLSHSADSEGRQARLRSRSSGAGSLSTIGGGGWLPIDL